jgi:DNA-binding NarL/FixJ family response regulator
VRSGDDPVRVVIAEDSVLLREGLAHLLGDAGLVVVGSCDDAPSLLATVERTQPDLALIDVRMPPTHTDEGLRAAHLIRARWPGVAVVVLSQYVEVRLASELIASGAERVGYLLKDRVADVAEFVAAIRRVACGGSSLDPMVVSQLLARRHDADEIRRLTVRELEVLGFMAQGLSNQAIANRLVVTVRAVEKHVTAIFDKLGIAATADAHRRVLAVLAYLRRMG